MKCIMKLAELHGTLCFLDSRCHEDDKICVGVPMGVVICCFLLSVPSYHLLSLSCTNRTIWIKYECELLYFSSK